MSIAEALCIKNTLTDQIGLGHPGLEITADQRSMIGRKLFLIGEEAGLPFILIGRNRFDHCLKDMLTCTR